MPVYKIHHKGITLYEIIGAPNQPQQIYPIHVFGIEHFCIPDGEMLISCPLEDVQVEKDGKPVQYHVVTTFSIGDKQLYNSCEIE